MHVKFWGVRGSIPAPGPGTKAVGGNTSCLQVIGEDGTELILDAGSGIRDLTAEDLGHAKRLHILLTHLHLDHIQGLLFFAPLFDSDAQVTVWGPPGRVPLRRRLARYLSDPLSPIEIGELPARVNFENVPVDGWRVDGLQVKAALVSHRGPTLGYRISEEGASLCYIPDHEPALGLELSSAPANWISGHSLAHDATALIHDAQYTDREYPSRRGWGHSSISDMVTFAGRTRPGRLLMFHHDPTHDDLSLELLAQQAGEQAASLGIDGRIGLAREGQTFEIRCPSS
jgi:phosphoribosyl 1,2-cyclic phosphodiesterase